MPQHSGVTDGSRLSDDDPLAGYEPAFTRRAASSEGRTSATSHSSDGSAATRGARVHSGDIDDFVETVPARHELPPYMRHRARSKRQWARPLTVCALLALIAGGLSSWSWRGADSSAISDLGTLVVSSHPSGAAVSVDGQLAGATPLAVELSVGPHDVAVRTTETEEQLRVEIRHARQTSRHVVLDEPAVGPKASTGSLHVESDPPGAEVYLSGRSRGTTPLTVGDLTPGLHPVELRSQAGTATREIRVVAGATSTLSLVLSTADAGVGAGGWIVAPEGPSVDIYEGDRLVGSRAQQRVMVPAGRHELTLVNETLGFRDRQTVTVRPGASVPLHVAWPTASLNVNALPWAEVSIDGVGRGQTPLGELAVPIGPHKVVFSHPTLGTRTADVVVLLGATNRVSVDLRK